MNENQLNLDEINNYSQAFAQRLSDYYFIDNQQIDGNKILSFCDIKQINLLIVKTLFEKWQTETAKLKSPFFDYNAPPVQKALKSFMNVLSMHISIQKAHFAPLLLEATRDTLLLFLAPRQFYHREFHKPHQQPLNRTKLSELQKYIQYNKQLLEAFIGRIDALGANNLSHSQAMQIFDEVLAINQEHLEPTEWRLKNFTDIYSWDTRQLFRQIKEDFSPQAALVDESPTVYIEQKPEAKEVDSPKMLNDLLKQESEKPNLAESFQQSKIANLRSAMSLNQKFSFINQLFQGDSLAFNDAITKIENCQSFKEARDLINKSYALKYNWDFEQGEIQRFMELLLRRFN